MNSNQKTSDSFRTQNAGEAHKTARVASDLSIALSKYEHLSSYPSLMSAICCPNNIVNAASKVTRNKGAGGVDGMKVEDLQSYLSNEMGNLVAQLQSGHYQPQPVRRVQIPKGEGKMRNLGIPTVVDRVIQQAILNKIMVYWEPSFSDFSYGFRPQRSCHQALLKATEYIKSGYEHVVNIDLEKFFDKVNHDKLMSELAKRIKDKQVLKLLRRYLTSGIMVNGVCMDCTEGVPQGGPLSPFLSNVMLDLLDKELERRGHRFVRYADDCIILTRSPRAGERVMSSMVNYIEKKLKLTVNKEKSEVVPFWHCRFLGHELEKTQRSENSTNNL